MGRIRLYDCNDYEDVNKILDESFGVTKKLNLSSDSFFELVYVDKGKVLGYLLVTKIFDPILSRLKYKIDYVCVDVDYRHLGIATLLVKRVFEYAKKEGIFEIELTSGYAKKNAHALYTKLGFKKKNSYLFKKIV